MSTWNVTEADRDGQGQIALDAPRKLADLLPGVEPAKTQPTRPLSGRQVGALAGVALILVAALVALLAQPQATPRPTAVPAAVPSPLPTAPPAPRQVEAYAAPAGAVLGLVDVGAVPVARYGMEWVQVPHDGAAVWIRAEGDVDLALPDLAPRPTTAPIVAAPPPPTMEAQTCIRTDYGQRCGPASKLADEEQVIAEIATESKERSQAWLATATAEAQP